MTAAGTTLAVGDAAHLSRLAWNVFARLPKGHPVLLVAAGATLAFATAAALAEHLVAMAGDRNADLPTPLRAYSRRARARIGADGKAASEHLNDDEWRAHHLIGVDSARNFPELLEHVPFAMAHITCSSSLFWRASLSDQSIPIDRMML